MTVAPQFAPELTTADRLRIITQQMLDRLFPEPALTPHQAAARHALEVKLANAQSFVPQGRGARRDPVPVCGAVFVTANKRFPKNLMVIRRGVDVRTARGLRAAPERLAAIEADFVARYTAQAPRVARVA